MKTKAILMLICIGMLTSCAGKFGVMKRRYNKGYYVSVTADPKTKNKHAKPEKLSVLKAEQEIVLTQRVEALEKKAEHIPIVSNEEKAPSFKAEKKSNTPVYASAGKSVRAVFRAKSLARELRNSQAAASNDMGASSVEPIVLVILCIILPPLAVYLFHNAINADFWLSLILTLLLWIPGIVFAFLVCFAGVSIA